MNVLVMSDWAGATFGIPSIEVRPPTRIGNPGGDEFAVGYGKPPVATRWKRGVSGNPSGKRKPQPSKEKTFFDVLAEKMSESVTYNDRGRKRKMTRLEAGATQLSLKVASGDPKYMRLFMDYWAKGLLQPSKLYPPPDIEELLTEDVAILEKFKAKQETENE